MLAGNIAPATQGRTVQDAFVVGPPAPGDAEPAHDRAHRRAGGDGPTVRRAARRPCISTRSANAPVTWLPQPTLDPSGAPLPEILLQQQNPAADPTPWSWFRRLLDAGEFDLAFTLDAARYTQIARNSDNTSSTSTTATRVTRSASATALSGIDPDDGTRFAAIYRVGAGAAGNVAADAISRLDPATLATGRYRRGQQPLASVRGDRMRRRCSRYSGLRRRPSARSSFAPSLPPTTSRLPRRCRGCSARAPCFAGPAAGSPSSPRPIRWAARRSPWPSAPS